jgi:hypothetical protein
MNPEISKDLIRTLVYDACSKDPSLVSTVIDAATEGVKAFSSKQRDSSSQVNFMLSQVLVEFPDVQNFGAFSRKDMLEQIESSFGGTKWHNDELKKLSSQQPLG